MEKEIEAFKLKNQKDIEELTSKNIKKGKEIKL